MSAAANLKPWQPGQSGNPGGKRKRIFPYVDEILKAAGVEPVTEILKLMPNLKEREQVQVWIELLPYVQAKAQAAKDLEPSELEKLSDAELLALVRTKIMDAK